MAKEITVSIDNRLVHTREAASILEAADQAGIYIPRLCYHPDLPPGPGTRADPQVYRNGTICEGDGPSGAAYDGCNMCIVDVEGKSPCRACATPVRDGMVIHTDSATVRELRRESLAGMLSLHPHACIQCAEKEGCDRETCSQNAGTHERCCRKFDECEFRKVCEYVTIRNDVSRCIFRNIPVTANAFFTFDPNLCIGCTRCIRSCEKTRGRRIIGFAYHNGEFVLGTSGPSPKESGCAFCGACVAVCPTGALMEKKPAWKKKDRLNFLSVVLPPEQRSELNAENIEKVPEENGVYELLDENNSVILIRGTANLRADLSKKLHAAGKARFFRYEKCGMYTMRETEMLENFLKIHGTLPEVNNEIADLY